MESAQQPFRQYYLATQSRMVKEPGRVFNEMLPEQGAKRPLGVLLASSIIYSLSSILIGQPEAPVVAAAVLFVNAIGMALIAAAVGYGLVALFAGRSVPFGQLLPIYALSSSITLLVAWLPYSVWLTEPWKWWLIGTGLTKGCAALQGWQALVIVISSIGVITLLFSAVLPHMAFYTG